MNYHLHHQGRDLGILPLEELQRRRESGELSGSEFVWCEGMANWQTLDSILYLVGLGAYNDMNSTVVRYRGVQIRRSSVK